MIARTFVNPSPALVEECFLRFIFGYEASYLNASIRTAYADLSRTLHGIGGKDPSGSLRGRAVSVLHDSIKEIAAGGGTQTEFDEWHKGTSLRLQETYSDVGFRLFVGQTQKWINMSVKYCALLGDRAVSGGRALFNLGHVPIDSIIVRALSRESLNLPADLRFESWSRIHDYATYMRFQTWVRERFPDSRPLAVEFYLWQEEMVLAQKRPGS